jgi:hypothetical protein
MLEPLWWAGLILLAVAFLIAQRRFYALHVRKKGWQPNPWRSFITFPSDVDKMTWRGDVDPEVERARRIYLATLVAWCVLGAGGMFVRFLAGFIRP